MPLTIVEVLNRSQEYLGRARIPNPRLEAELLLAHSLNVSRLELYLRFDQPLSEDELVRCRRLVGQRSRHWPTAYLLGEKEFYGLPFAVGPGVLIPRPETELLVDLALERALARGTQLLCADLGSGSGCVGISLAVKARRVLVTAVDSESVPLLTTSENAARHGVDDRVQVVAGSWSEPLERARRYQILISNPPYVTTAEWLGLEPEVRDHEPRQALDGGEDGLDAYRILLPQLDGVAAPGAVFLMEGDPSRLGAVSTICRGLWPEARIQIHQDLSHRDRVLEVELP